MKPPWPAKIGALRALFSEEAASGLALMLSALAALLVANSRFASLYFEALSMRLGPLTLVEWINDALMALFFLLVGLEIKREWLGGELTTWRRRALPGIAALGGMIAPALIFCAFAFRTPAVLRVWAIPTATDIAFALGVLALLGARVPASLKIFLAALAVIDDLGAILIIAVFYTSHVSLPMLGGAGLCFAVLLAFNRLGVRRLWPYLIVGPALWMFVLASGVHATLAGVLLAAAIPYDPNATDRKTSPLLRLEHGLTPIVAFGVTPIFGFANAGVSFAGVGLAGLFAPLTLAVAAGLFFGKQIGVFAAARTAVALGWASRPQGATWTQIYGASLICGIGFTMSLFIGLLAFSSDAQWIVETKLGVLMGSMASAGAGTLVLLLAGRPILPPANGSGE